MKALVASLVLGTLAASHAWATSALDQLLACRRLPDSAARLECFDRASDAALTTEQPVTTPTTSASASSKPAAIESSIVRISQPLTGPADFTLENGQVWRQMDAESAKAAKIGDRVVVSKAFLGAYWLRIEGGRAWRVTLVR